MEQITRKLFSFILLFLLSFPLFAEQEFSEKQYFVDSAQMLTECLYVIQKTGRFDIVEKQILSNAKIGKIPSELQNISKRIIDTCDQGKIALRSQKIINDEYSNELTSIGFKTGFRVGSSLAMDDPVTAIWAVFEGYSSFSSATAKNNERIDAVLQQMEYRIKSDMYDLRNIITEKAEKYGVDGASIISFDAMEEIEKMLPKFNENPDSILAFTDKYPYYSKLQYYAIKYGARDSQLIYNKLIDSKNSILYNDPDRLNACACMGNYTIFFLFSNSIDLSQEDRANALDNLKEEVEYGLKNGGHSSPVFHFMRGVANSIAQYYGLKKISENDIWSDLLFEKELDQGEFMKYQSLWCAAWLATNMQQSERERLEDYLKAALKVWTPASVMNNSPFKRTRNAQEVYKKVMEIKWSWSVYWGFFNDDIILSNDSDFPLNNVVLSVSLTRKATGKKEWTKDIKCSYIAPHDSYKWTDIMSISSGSDESITGNAILNCDEDLISTNAPSKLITLNATTAIALLKEAKIPQGSCIFFTVTDNGNLEFAKWDDTQRGIIVVGESDERHFPFTFFSSPEIAAKDEKPEESIMFYEDPTDFNDGIFIVFGDETVKYLEGDFEGHVEAMEAAIKAFNLSDKAAMEILKKAALIDALINGEGNSDAMANLEKQFSYLPDILVEFEDMKLTKLDLFKEIIKQDSSPHDYEHITKEFLGETIQKNLDDVILLHLAQKAGFIPTAQLVKDNVMKELNDFTPEQRKELEDSLKPYGATLKEQIAKLSEIKSVQNQTAMQLFVNKYAEDAAKKDITDAEIKEFFKANRSQFPGRFEEEKSKVIEELVRKKAPEKAEELDIEIEAIRKDVKYWKP